MPPTRSPLARALRAATLVLSGQVAAQGLGLARNIVLARLLGPADMGVAATIGLLLSFLEALGDAGTDRLLVQAEDGDDPRLQAAAHTAAVGRGAGLALLAGALGLPLAGAFEVRDQAWGYLLVAAILVVRGFAHLDVRRYQRTFRFGPGARVDVWASALALAAAAPIALWRRDFSAVLLAMLVQSCAATALSHVAAERPYALSADRARLRRLAAFGLPLALNGALFFAFLQGDRVLLVLSATKADVGRFGAAFALGVLPTVLLARVTQNLALPFLSAARGPGELDARARAVGAAVGAASTLFGAGFAGLGGVVVAGLYGAAFRPDAALAVAVAAGAVMRLLREGPVAAALSRADAGSVLRSNVVRLSGLALGVGVALLGGGAAPIVGAAAAGEAVALGHAALRLRRHGIAPATVLAPAVPAVGGLAAGAAFAAGAPVPAAGLLLLAVGAAAVSVLRAVRRALPRHAAAPWPLEAAA
ncbi:MAG: oligosaccharide flippase family protein [Planctomycetota bacterium]